ncbi:TIGR03986 family type III CRISPR-associated RAMP protein [Micromonospora sp. SH-82]|uniref:TIGR03986 family type III CRISPR-associated RAMP protein n=1 Tax=Micromonospora sp. SH-82 TaxID=3132938 RepID=UPI003EBC6665
MNGPVNKLEKTVSAELTKRGDSLEGVIRSSDRAKDNKPKRLVRSQWDGALAEHVDTMTDGDTVTVEVTTNLADNGKRTARLAGVASLAKVNQDHDRSTLLAKTGGFVNPYTFVPTLPRSDRKGTRLSGTDLDDGPPRSHAYHADGQWSGTLSLTLTTVTPLLLPVPAATQPKDGPRTFDVRVDPHGRPLIHGASLKGALRSAYETVTASRYGVFAEHHERLAYRTNASAALNLTPARVHTTGDGEIAFRLCRGDADWARHSRSGNQAQFAALVPAYGPRPAKLLGDLSGEPLSRHHGFEVFARVVHAGEDGKGSRGARTWRVTHLARTEEELQTYLRTDRSRPAGGNGRHRIVRGWLSATGRSIGTKHHERLFVETPGLDVPRTDEHVSYWKSVLRAYDLAQGYNDPQATYRRDPVTAEGIERSWHVVNSPRLQTLPAGTLVYVKYDEKRHEITEVHPVMIGRLPFDASPGDLLHESLRPAQTRDQLSPADRLFGWVPPGRSDDGTDTNDGASGYRGRLRVRSITCTTDDWRPSSFPDRGVTLAPLSSPKPTQFRFYASPDKETGAPTRRGIPKADGYPIDGGLRGRKMYRWREEEPGYWEPTKGCDDPSRGYLALKDHEQHATQVVCHRGWVRPEVTFQVDLFLDGVPDAELGALMWLLTRGEAAPLRLGAGKPYGFGVITAQLDLDRTRMWDAAGVRTGWMRLSRPEPVGADRLTALVDRFDATARGNEVLREATESYLRATKPVAEPVHYPRMTPTPQAESYEWFVANDRVVGGKTVQGWPLPHVRDADQRLPYLGSDHDGPQQAGRGGAGRPERRVPSPRPAPGKERRPQSGQGLGKAIGDGANQRAAGRGHPGGKDNRTSR